VSQDQYTTIKNTLEKELLIANTFIDKTENFTAITAPENFLGVVSTEEGSFNRELKLAYIRKRKVLNFLDRLPTIDSFLCSHCGEIIDLDRLLHMQKASLCEICAEGDG
jgi:RNA polymerase-binding transcription factor DksA